MLDWYEKFAVWHNTNFWKVKAKGLRLDSGCVWFLILYYLAHTFTWKVNADLSLCLVAELQSCLLSSADVGCGMFQCLSNNSCEIRGLDHICLTLLHNAGHYDLQVRISQCVSHSFTLKINSLSQLCRYACGALTGWGEVQKLPGQGWRRHIWMRVFISFNPFHHCGHLWGMLVV